MTFVTFIIVKCYSFTLKKKLNLLIKDGKFLSPYSWNNNSNNQTKFFSKPSTTFGGEKIKK